MKRSPRNVKISFSGKRLTHFGGLYLLQKFFQKINLRSLLSQYLHFLQRNNRYAVAEEMLALIYPISLGLGRIETSHLLKHNGVFQYLTGITYLSQSNHPETFPSSDGPLSSSQIEETPRPVTFVHDPKTKTSDQGDLRSGFHRTYPLWQTGDGSDRLQSPEVGSPLLSSPSLFQWDHQRFLAWRTSSWRYPYGYWNRRTPEGGLCQITSLCKDRNYPSRQGFLRSRDHRISGVQESPFCHCCQAYRLRSREQSRPCLIKSIPLVWRPRSLCINPQSGKRNIVLWW